MCMNNPKPYSRKQPRNYIWGYKIVSAHSSSNPISLYPIFAFTIYRINAWQLSVYEDTQAFHFFKNKEDCEKFAIDKSFTLGIRKTSSLQGYHIIRCMFKDIQIEDTISLYPITINEETTEGYTPTIKVLTARYQKIPLSEYKRICDMYKSKA